MRTAVWRLLGIAACFACSACPGPIPPWQGRDWATFDAVMDSPAPESEETVETNDLSGTDVNPDVDSGGVHDVYTDAVPDSDEYDVRDHGHVHSECVILEGDPEAACGRNVEFPDGHACHEVCVIVPAGHCHITWIGSVPNNYYSRDNEFPRRRVRLTGYAMSRFPVTVAEFRRCVHAGVCRSPVEEECLDDDASVFEILPATPNFMMENRLDHPVNCVSYSDAESFCRWIGGTLPTEARYEYAAAGPVRSEDVDVRFPWGTDADNCHVNIRGTDPFDETSPVGFFDGSVRTRAEGGWLFGPDEYRTCNDESVFGMRDIVHNVMEIVKDGPSEYRRLNNDETDPEMKPECPGISMRSTAWRWPDVHHSRVSTRHLFCMDQFSLLDHYPKDRDILRFPDLGFRCAFDLHKHHSGTEEHDSDEDDDHRHCSLTPSDHSVRSFRLFGQKD